MEVTIFTYIGVFATVFGIGWPLLTWLEGEKR